MSVRILQGDCRQRLRDLPNGSVDCVVTSPPYFNLRDYGVKGQIGLELTPAEYVRSLVMALRHVRRVLSDAGTLWLNLGDSYTPENRGENANPRRRSMAHLQSTYMHADLRIQSGQMAALSAAGLRRKQLIGIPWMVANALSAQEYLGRIERESDRAWLAGFLDGEGTITFTERDRGHGHTSTHDAKVCITNCDRDVLDYFRLISGGHVYQHEDGKRQNRFGSRPCFRWQMGTHDSALLIRELYPYLRVKKDQAALIWTLYTTLRHRNGHARTPVDVVEKRRAIADMVRALNKGKAVDMPAWVEQPPPPTQPGWLLRQEIIWHKPNPMPEPVRDRCTRSHESLFLFTKGEDYYFDAAAISEPATKTGSPGQMASGRNSRQNVPRTPTSGNTARKAPALRGASGGSGNLAGSVPWTGLTRNKRSVWTVPVQPFMGAHFATFPPALIEPCILAGTKRGGVVLDPFAGAGTTGLVANRLGRDAVLIELNAKYVALARTRLRGERTKILDG